MGTGRCSTDFAASWADRLDRPGAAKRTRAFKGLEGDRTGMGVATTVTDYYEALRRGEPLYPYFAERDDVVKFGVGERLTGYDAVAEGLREQSRTTGEWTVESHDLLADSAGGVGWFSDDVTLEWTDLRADERYSFETRWSGTLARRDVLSEKGEAADEEWLFVGLHVSAPHEL